MTAISIIIQVYLCKSHANNCSASSESENDYTIIALTVFIICAYTGEASFTAARFLNCVTETFKLSDCVHLFLCAIIY